MSINDFLQQLLAHMGVDKAEIKVVEKDDAQEVGILVDEQDSGLLIGHHAETIASLQVFLRSALQKTSDKVIRLNINDFREHREERVREIARSVAERVISTNQMQILRLPANERRIVHTELATFPGVETVSEGEGVNRVLCVKPKAN